MGVDTKRRNHKTATVTKRRLVQKKYLNIFNRNILLLFIYSYNLLIQTNELYIESICRAAY